MSNRRIVRLQIAAEEADLQNLKVDEERVSRERRELLVKSVLSVAEERELRDVETQLLTLHARRDSLASRVAERKRMLPELEIEEHEATDRLPELKEQITQLTQELTTADAQAGELYRQAQQQQQNGNELAQQLTALVTERDYLSQRFELNGSGLQLPERPDYHPTWQQVRVLSFFEPTQSGDYKDKLHRLSRERNALEKRQRQEQADRQAREWQGKQSAPTVG